MKTKTLLRLLSAALAALLCGSIVAPLATYADDSGEAMTEVTVNDSETGNGTFKFDFKGPWVHEGGYPNRFEGGDEHWITSAQFGTNYPSVTFRFVGTRVALYGHKMADSPFVRITLDGQDMGTVDLYHPTRVEKVLLYESDSLPDGDHVITLQVLADKNPSAGGTHEVSIDYAVITTKKEAAAMKNVTVNDTVITAGAGTTLASVCCTARDAGLAGLSFAYGIPGTLGGAVYMNAGAYGGEIGDRILTVTALDADTGELRTYTREDCAFGYRTSAFIGTHHIVLEATLSTDPGDPAAIRAEMEDITARRREKQPLEYPSAGSAFKRYPGYFTAQLIDEAGLKGYTVGGAQVSEKHAGFIVNRGGATCEDVLTLIDAIRAKIRALHSIEIEPEIRRLDECIVVPAEGMLST